MRRVKYSFWAVFLALFFYTIPQAEAISPHLLISEIQVAGASSSEKTKEFVEIYNQSSNDINIKDLKVEYLTSSGNATTILTESTSVMLRARQFMLLSRTGYLSDDYSFETGLNETGGSIRLKYQDVVIDTVGWGSATVFEGIVLASPAYGTSMKRNINPDTASFNDTDVNNADFGASVSPSPQGGGLYEPSPVIDVCPNITGDQETVPEGYTTDSEGDCVAIVIEPTPTCQGIETNEIVPNPSGEDNGAEFVELHNTTNGDVSLVGCFIKVGSNQLTLEGTLEANGYKAFYGLTLPNAAGGDVEFITATTETVTSYPQNLDDDESWSLINGNWELSNIPTPNAANQPSVEEPATGGKGTDDSTLAPCPPGKYRNPDTNRCRKITTGSSLTPCGPGEYRNPATNRCRKTSGSGSSLTPCDPGEYRNPATNRCRKLSSTNSSLTPCKPGYARNKDTNRCRKVAGSSTANSPLTNVASAASSPVSYPVLAVVAFLSVGYGIFEYRQDIRNFFAKILSK